MFVLYNPVAGVYVAANNSVTRHLKYARTYATGGQAKMSRHYTNDWSRDGEGYIKNLENEDFQVLQAYLSLDPPKI
jgi:hypothetical protein